MKYERRCSSKCNSYISSTNCNINYESSREIQEGDLCHEIFF